MDEGKDAERQKLVAEVGREVRELGAQSVITSAIVAARFSLHTTDLECLDLIFLRGEASAGELSAATGLSSGATTTLIDRLERRGFVERVADPADRRRVKVRIREVAIEPIKAVYLPIQERMFALWSSYSARELRIILGFLAKSRTLAAECAADIQRASPPPARRRPARAGRTAGEPLSPPARRGRASEAEGR